MAKRKYHNDLDVLSRIKEGDEDAFAVLFRDYKDKLYGFFFDLTHSADKAEDLVQDIFLKIWQGRNHLNKVNNINAYIFRVAQNYAIDQLRKTTKEILSFSDTFETDMDALSLSPEDTYEKKELNKIMQAAVDTLPNQQKKIFILRYIESLSHEEIAKSMNISVSTTQNHMRHALANVRLFLRQNYPGVLNFLLPLFLL